MAEEQTQTTTWSSARLHLVLGPRTLDVVLPAEVPVADLLPVVLPQFGAEVVEAGAEHEGWVLQRWGEDALDEELTPTQLGLQDGETLHLRPRTDQLPAVDYDDVVAGLGEQVRAHEGVWSPGRTRVMLLAGAAVLLGLGIPLLLLDGSGGARSGGAAAFVALLLLAGAALVARGTGDVGIATLLAGLSAGYAAAGAGRLSVVLVPFPTTSAALTCAFAAAVGMLAVGVVVVADAALIFTGALTATAALTVAAFVGTLGALSIPETAAVALSLTVVAGFFVPSLAFRLSGSTLPLLPTAPDQLREDVDPVPHELVVERGAATVGYTAALHVGLGAAQVPLLLATASGGGWATVLAVTVAGLLLLRVRHPNGAIARWAMLVPAAAALVGSVVALAAGMSTTDRLIALLLPVLALGALLLWLVDVMPGRRLQPYWGRAVDLAESVTAISLVPILLAVLGTYAWTRGLAG